MSMTNLCIFWTNFSFFTPFHFRKNIAECAIHVAYRIARHAILATCANHPVVIPLCVVIHVIPVAVMYVVAIIDYICAIALIVNFMSKRIASSSPFILEQNNYINSYLV